MTLRKHIISQENKSKGVRQRSGDDTALFPRDMRLSQKPAFLQKGHLEAAGILKPHTNADKVTRFTEIDNFLIFFFF